VIVINFSRTHQSKTVSTFAVYILLLLSFVVSAADTDYWALNFTTSKKFQYHYRQSFNKGWLFYQGAPSGTPSATVFNDGSWQKVNVPHSVSYDAPDQTSFYQGVAWYRKKFVLPANVSSGLKKYSLNLKAR
jgi:hypothetical protein